LRSPRPAPMLASTLNILSAPIMRLFIMLRRCLRTGVLPGLLFLAVAVAPSPAQRTTSIKPRVFAIRDARVVTEPGKVLEKATIVIRDGVIDAVGADVTAPAEALVIDGKGLTVYPGFLDATSNFGYDNALRRSEAGPAATEDLASDALAATKADNRKGVTPEFLVSAALKADDEAADGWRKLGFTAHLIAPDGGAVVGQSALVSLSGAPAREAVLRSPFAQHVSLRIVPGEEYPRALMGVVAHARQTFLDAGHNARLWKRYEEAGRAGRRPPQDPAYAALVPALEGKQPVVFEADSRDEIHRALDFAAEFKLKPILYGGRQAEKVVDRLKEAKVPVLLRLNFSEGLPARPSRIRPMPTGPLEPRRTSSATTCAN
jgi:imidazolonepropionase-like amidohydrolase